MTQKQITTATVIGTITLSGNASVIVTSARMGNSPKTFSVAVTNGNDASAVANLIRLALAFDADVSAAFLVSGATDKVILTEHLAHANDSTLNISIANGTCTGLTAAPASAATQAGIGISNGYCTLADLRSAPALNFDVSDNSVDDLLSDIITTVSREIDYWTGRYFYNTNETRYFSATEEDTLFVGDLVSLSALYTDTDDGQRTYPNQWQSTDYDLAPYNRQSVSEPEPYNYVDKAPVGQFTYPIHITKGVKVIGVWGWQAVPAIISKACLLWSERTYKRLSTPLGTSSLSALGTVSVKVPPPDPDIEMMLRAYRTHVI